ncbi:transposase [Streptomyces canus]|uniref:transposase n=1 Tax=Streptomyces canus TaxID=58343 RepID=UPI0032550827
MKNYPPQFKADAVALYQSRPEATIRQVAADLGINPEPQRNWGRAAGASWPRGHRAEVTSEPPTPLDAVGRRWTRRTPPSARRSSDWKREREILRKAAKYFAGETRW